MGNSFAQTASKSSKILQNPSNSSEKQSKSGDRIQKSSRALVREYKKIVLKRYCHSQVQSKKQVSVLFWKENQCLWYPTVCFYRYNMKTVPERLSWGGVADFEPAHSSNGAFRDQFQDQKVFLYHRTARISIFVGIGPKLTELGWCYFFETSNFLVFHCYFFTEITKGFWSEIQII